METARSTWRPIFYTQTGFWYNATLVGEGKEYEVPTTWDEFFELGKQAKARRRALFTYPQPGYFDATMYAMLAQAGGTDFYNNALTYDENTWTSDEGKKVLDTIATLVSLTTCGQTPYPMPILTRIQG